MIFKNEELPYSINDMKDLLDKEQIFQWLSTSYWASERPKELIFASFEHSICFGVYGETGQVGFARVVTDYTTFSWVCDVFIDPAHRGKGLSKWLMEVIVQHPAIAHTNMLLATRDAHGLYEQYGFVRREAMRRMANEQAKTPVI
ncbi:GCN5 family acetyltransferase [Brevibacillus choshinensis]|uniref:GCN5 family acetyltransferase n=1 Tax=Brevibacillus choshinensis TaxID=54911 RepID=A0ABR5N678_BRECH|nr:GNAT family N-acetyltransferase [Brevibacillus choshinensis]KQL45962.1 GCN5 family acetyltransferase [Brevibacillus choshinensis]